MSTKTNLLPIGVSAFVSNEVVEASYKDNQGMQQPCDIDRTTAEALFASHNQIKPCQLYRSCWYEAGNQFSDKGSWSTDPRDEVSEDR